jgi:hypothetical protein
VGQRYEYGIDFDRVEAIDVHTHVEVDGHGHKAYDDVLVKAPLAGGPLEDLVGRTGEAARHPGGQDRVGPRVVPSKEIRSQLLVAWGGVAGLVDPLVLRAVLDGCGALGIAGQRGARG